MRDIEGIDQVIEALRPHWRAIDDHFNQQNSQFKMLLEADHDLIGRVLKCHLVVEHYLDRYLLSHLKLQHLEDARLTFAQKATLLPSDGAAAAFVKPGILRLNAIRNRFGHTLQPALSMGDLGAIQTVLGIARENVPFDTPIEAIEAFTTVACTWLIVPPPELQEVFVTAFRAVRTAGA
jgi:hypothetical protein